MRLRKKRKYNAHNFLKKYQHVTDLLHETVTDTAIDELLINARDHRLNLRCRSKLGYTRDRNNR